MNYVSEMQQIYEERVYFKPPLSLFKKGLGVASLTGYNLLSAQILGEGEGNLIARY